MDPVIIVSNRLPISIGRAANGSFTYNHTSGGLGTAIASLNLAGGHLWIGWPGIASDDLTESEKEQITNHLIDTYDYIPVFQTKQQISDFYEGYSNDTLWPLFHYFPEKANYQDRYWQAYQQVNELYRQAVENFAENASTIWIHDYHLMLLPELVRQTLPESKIGFFLHTPFPSYELFRQLPERNELISGLLGADLVGFQIYDYARHFFSSASRLIGAESRGDIIEYNGRHIKVDTYPIGIDNERFTKQLNTRESQTELAVLEDHYKGQKLIVAIDRLDYSKGIIERMRGFETFLEQHPNLHSKTTLYMIEAPSRTEVQAYKQLRDTVELMVSRINGTYGTAAWTPIIYLFQNFGFDKIAPLYNRADIALITPLRDGMNLVAKEYIACKQNRPGVLVLSETIGAADELLDAILVNPNNTQQIANAIYQAIKMPVPEQRRRMRRLKKRISEYSVQRWASDYMTDLIKAAKSHKGQFKNRLTEKKQNIIINKYRKARNRLLLLDYDGTLMDFVSAPVVGSAKPDAALLELIGKLQQHKDTKIVITSGRTKETMQKWFGAFPRIALVAEHGAWIKDHNEWVMQAKSFNKRPYLRAMKQFAPRTAGAVVDAKDFGVVWHYRSVNPELAFIRNGELRTALHQLAEGSDIGIYDGRKIIEVKPKHLHKGVIAREFSDRYPSDFILAIGNDYTDEQMFEALPPHAATIKIGPGPTGAHYQVANASAGRRLLQSLGQAVKRTKSNHL